MVWGDADPGEVRSTWAAELGAFVGDDLREALQALGQSHPSYPPTLFEFAGLCRDARKRHADRVLKLAAPRTGMPDHIRAQLRAFRESHTFPQREPGQEG